MPDVRLDVDQVLFQLRPAREPVRARGHQLRVGQRESITRLIGARVKLPHQRQRIAVPGGDRLAQRLGDLAQTIERRIVRKGAWWHSNLLARIERAEGLWSA